VKRVRIESPFKARGPRVAAVNLHYAKEAVRDSLERGEAPFASHLLYPQCRGARPDDEPADARGKGLSAGLAWYCEADLCAVYADHGVTPGMRMGIAAAVTEGLPVDVRFLCALDDGRAAEALTAIRSIIAAGGPPPHDKGD